MMIREWKRVLKNDGVKVFTLDPGLLATGLGGVGEDKLKAMGAADPIEGGRFVLSVMSGERDEDEDKMINSGGTVPW